RSMSNNTVVCNDISELPNEFWEPYYDTGCGEPYGLFNKNLCRKVGRLCDGDKYPDPLIEGPNPCAEQILNNGETCDLAEIFLPNSSSYKELKDVCFLLYRVGKHSLLLPCHHEITEKIVQKNMRMRISVSGYLQATEDQRKWLPNLY